MVILSHQEKVVLRIELYGREFCRHGRLPVRPKLAFLYSNGSFNIEY